MDYSKIAKVPLRLIQNGGIAIGSGVTNFESILNSTPEFNYCVYVVRRSG